MKKIILWLMVFLPITLVAQKNQVIKGKVLAEDGTTLPGASVYIDKNTIGEASKIKGVVKNFNLGTTTDINGAFSLEIPKGVTELKCSFIGYGTRVINVKGKSFVTITMKEEQSMLDEVVVTGYQKIEQRKLTSAVTKVDSKEILQAGVSSVDQMLEGQLAGVQTTIVSGAPGAPAKIRIRGTASLEGTQDPLWVLDGIPLEGMELPDMTDKNIDELFNSSIANVNPEDIENITVLKDAAATAIYGARAANGVIVITTKKGKKGKLNVNVRTNTSFVAKPDFSKLNLMNSSQKIDMELSLAKYKDLLSYSNSVRRGAIGQLFEKNNLWTVYQEKGFAGLPKEVQDEINGLRNINTNWGDELYQTAINQDHSLSISGGTDKATYYFSAGYYNEKGTTIGTGMDRLNFTLKTDYNLLDNLTVGVSLFSTNRNQESYSKTEGAMTTPARYSRVANPYLRIYDEQGNFVYDTNVDISYQDKAKFNIIEERQNTSYDNKVNSLLALFNLDWEIVSKLHFRTQFGLQKENIEREQYGHKDSFLARRARAASAFNYGKEYFIPEGGVIKNWNTNSSQWTLKNILEYSLRVKDIHEFDIMFGNELRRNKNKQISTAGYGFNKETLTTIPIIFPKVEDANRYPLYGKSFVENAFVSMFGTLGYTFNNKYTFFGSFRLDGSDLFGADPKFRYQPLWAASGSWRVNRENFLKDIKWLNDLKLRASYGLQGNIDKATSKFIVGDKKQVKILPDTTEMSITPTNMPNDRLRWEKTATWNVGFDLAVLDNRIKLSTDFYHRKSTDIIGSRGIPLENGLGVTMLNWAALTNKGFELNLNTLNISTKDFKWNTVFNISKNINTVDQIYERDDAVTPSLKGHSVNALFAFKTAGLDENGFILFEKDGKKMSAEEFFQMEDKLGYGYFSSKLSDKEFRDRYTFIGNNEPKLSGGFINSFTYKGFTLDISTSFSLGKWVKREPFYKAVDMDRGLNRTTMMNKVWTPDNKGGIYPRMVAYETKIDGKHVADYALFNPNQVFAANVFRDLDIWYKKMDIFRVNSIRFGYKLPKSILDKVGVSFAKLSVEARNPFVFGTDYNGFFDPETYGNIYAQPIPKSVTVGLSVNF